MGSKFGSHTSVQATPRVCHAAPPDATPWPPLAKQILTAHVNIYHHHPPWHTHVYRKLDIQSAGGEPIEWWGDRYEWYPNITVELEYFHATNRCNLRVNFQLAGYPQWEAWWPDWTPKRTKPFATGLKRWGTIDYEWRCTCYVMG